MRPAIKAGLLWVWRDRDTLQIGIDPRRAVALRGMRGAAGLVGLLDGSRDLAQVFSAADERGIPRETVDRVIALLSQAGALHDFPAGALRGLPDGTRGRLEPELATVSLAHGDADGGAAVLARRQVAAVHVHGMGSVGSGVASLLSAAGVGQVTITGAVDGEAVGAAEQMCQDRRNRPHTSPRPGLAVLAGSQHPELSAALMRERIPHLAASAGEAIGVVGPFVLPGESACLRCLDLARADRDPAWPFILAQAAGRDPSPPACDAILATTVAAQATAQALIFIDRGAASSAVTNGTLELVLPGWQWRRRTWNPHRDCGCSRRTETCPRMRE
jgi:hypothetical protein